MKRRTALRDARLARNATVLAAHVADERRYRHANARIEDKATVIPNATSDTSKRLSLDDKHPWTRVGGDAAIAGFNRVAASEAMPEGRQSDTNLRISMVCQAHARNRMLLARRSTGL